MSPLHITDPSSGDAVGATDHRLNVSARTNTRAYYRARDNGLCFSWSAATYDYDAGDTILLVKNTHETKDLHFHHILVSGDTATEVIVHRPTAEVTTPTGTAVTGVNLNGNSNNVASASAKADETTNALGSTLFSFRMPANTPISIGLEGVISLGQNQSIAVDFVTNGAACNVTLVGYYEDE